MQAVKDLIYYAASLILKKSSCFFFTDSLPYKFMNQSLSIYPHEDMPPNIQKGADDLMENPKFDLKEGFLFAYKSLLYSIIEGNEPMIDSICEHKLAESIVSNLGKFVMQFYQLLLCLKKHH